MAKYLGYRNGAGHCDIMCASDAEKTTAESVDTAQGRQVTYVSVTDADYNKEHDITHSSEYDGSAITWQSTANDATLETSKADAQQAINEYVAEIEAWLESPAAQTAGSTVKSTWTTYKNELSGIDLDSKTWPMTGTHPLAGLVSDGSITTWMHIKRLP